MNLTYVDPKKENWFLVSWTLSNKCNYRCSYCPSNLHDGSSGWPSWESVKNFIENFKLPGKEICYRISGGEPTYWKHFIDMAKTAKDQGHTFSFLTNGSQSVDYFKSISEYTDGMILSYHPEYADVHHCVEVAKTIKGVVAVNLMLVPERFDELLSVADSLYNGSPNVVVWPKVILDKSDINHISNQVADYTDNQRKIIEQWPYFRSVNDYKMHRGEIALNGRQVSGNDLILKGLNNFEGWNCWAGQHMISIDQWGDVYRADCQQGGKIGTINSFTMPQTLIVCRTNKCSCLSDIYLKKVLE